MMMMRFAYAFGGVLFVAMTFMPTVPASAQMAGDEAFLFAYYPKEGMQARFDEGYRRHLDWHRAHDDQLPWFAWYVLFGERTGMFIDGTFGISYQAMDGRVDPAGDGADFAQTTAPFGETAFRRVYRLRRDLSTATALEDRAPSRMIQVVHVRLRAGHEAAFESVLQQAKEAAPEDLHVTWYELIAGGRHPSYMLMVPRANLTAMSGEASPLRELVSYLGSDGEDRARTLSDVILDAESELWAYRADLSLFSR